MVKKDNFYSRRSFLKESSYGLTGIALSPLVGSLESLPKVKPLEYHIFSKHLQFLNYSDMAEAAADLGFDGVDLTVRNKGHVQPEQVERDLPMAVEAIRKAGLKHQFMASNVDFIDNPLHQRVIRTAARQGIQYYRMNYLRYTEDQSIPKRLKELNEKMKELAQFNAEHKIIGAYQNHSGTMIGSQLWELHQLLKKIPKDQIGVQYDIRHGVVEGGMSWPNNLRLIARQINCIVLKDFVWEKNDQGQWKVKNVPLGEGMVDFVAYFQQLKQLGIQVPAIIHYEYDLGGAEHGDADPTMPTKEIFNHMRKDLAFAKRVWEEA